MAVTVLEVTNKGSKWQKSLVFEHEEDLGVFRKRVTDLARGAVTKRIAEGTANPFSVDDIWADIEAEFPRCRYQFLDLRVLIGVPNENVEITDILPSKQP